MVRMVAATISRWCLWTRASRLRMKCTRQTPTVNCGVAVTLGGGRVKADRQAVCRGWEGLFGDSEGVVHGTEMNGFVVCGSIGPAAP